MENEFDGLVENVKKPMQELAAALVKNLNDEAQARLDPIIQKEKEVEREVLNFDANKEKSVEANQARLRIMTRQIDEFLAANEFDKAVTLKNQLKDLEEKSAELEKKVDVGREWLLDKAETEKFTAAKAAYDYAMNIISPNSIAVIESMVNFLETIWGGVTDYAIKHGIPLTPLQKARLTPLNRGPQRWLSERIDRWFLT